VVSSLAAAGIGVIVLVSIFSISSSGASPALGRQSPAGARTVTPRQIHYKVNARGLTYGSAQYARNVASEPDLILVVATNGKEGYAKKSDLEGDGSGLPSNPAEAATYSPSATSIPVYDSDGVTQIGSFQIDPGSTGSPSPASATSTTR
jgi:hypothetical protein